MSRRLFETDLVSIFRISLGTHLKPLHSKSLLYVFLCMSFLSVFLICLAFLSSPFLTVLLYFVFYFMSNLLLYTIFYSLINQSIFLLLCCSMSFAFVRNFWFFISLRFPLGAVRNYSQIFIQILKIHSTFNEP